MKNKIFKMRNYYVLNLMIIGMILCIYLLTASSDVHMVMGSVGVSPYYKGDATKKQVGISIHCDNASQEVINRAIDVLDQENTTATFFVDSQYAISNGKMLQSMDEKKFEIGLLGRKNKSNGNDNVSAVQNEIVLWQQTLKTNGVANSELYCPVDGKYTREIMNSIYELGYTMVIWSINAVDPRAQSGQEIAALATQKLQNGIIIRLNADECMIEALPIIIKEIKDQGYEIVTVGSMID